MLLDKGIGNLMERNFFARLPHEVPHNDMFNDLETHEFFKKYLELN